MLKVARCGSGDRVFFGLKYTVLHQRLARFASGDALLAQLNYHEPASGMRLGRYIVPPSHFQYEVTDTVNTKEVLIGNARSSVADISLQDNGFLLKAWPSACADFSDDSCLLRTYYDEMRSLIEDVSGAKQVMVFDHVVRKEPRCENSNMSGAVARVHCDYTEDSARSVMEHVFEQGVFSKQQRRTLRQDELQSLMRRDVIFFNVWRNIIPSAPLQAWPLAVCDARSVPTADRLYYEVIYPIYSGIEAENYALQFNRNHKWYYYSDMTQHECLVFRQYDSTGKTDPVFHTAFENTAGDTSVRESIEVRVMAFFGDDLEKDSLHRKARLKGGKMIRAMEVHE